MRFAARYSVVIVAVLTGGCDHVVQPRNKTQPQATASTNMTPLQRISTRVNKNGDVNDPSTRRPLLMLSEFFDGNDDFGSICCNLSPPPGPVMFHEILKKIAARSDVADVRIQITMFDDPTMWPFSDTVWIITSATPQAVAEWFDPAIRPDDCSAGWTENVSFEPIAVPEGMRPVACWWD